MSRIDQVVTVGDRLVYFASYGPEDGHRVLVLTGTPGTRLLGPRMTRVADSLELHVVVPDRPGYGPSTRQPGREVADVAGDVEAIADQLGWDRFGIWGGSGGGPHALACAALLPARVTRCACVVSPAPYGVEDLDYFDGMPLGNVKEFSLALEGEHAYRPLVEQMAEEMVESVRAGVVSIGEDFPLSDADKAALAGRLSEPGYLERTIAANLDGIDGWIDDSIALVRPWGFDLASINVPVSVWSAGDDDSLCPPAHSEWLAAHIPGAEFILLPHGHILEEDDLRAIFSWVLTDD